jgi:parallel beta-helix repeat protein
LNVYSGNGSATSTFPSGVSNNFGVGLVGTSKDNLIENNKIGGNLNGVLLASTTQGGNVIRRNTIAGNPPVQVSKEFGAPIGADIQDLSTPGTNTFEDNHCLTYAGSVSPAPCPNVAKQDNDEDRQEHDMAAFGKNRLAFPQARLVNAVLRGGLPPMTNAAYTARNGNTPASDAVTVTGRVVDAACFMLHALAATSTSHMNCAAACLARGVPLAIATDDGTLYFPADGNKQLKALLNAHVRASGTIVEKSEPMELKMPVGEKNQMVVRLEGGYRQITLQALKRIPAAKS